MIPRVLAVAASLVLLAVAQPAGRQPDAPRGAALFHHIHLLSPGNTSLVNFYERLFPPEAIARGVFWGAEGIRGNDVFLLWSRVAGQRAWGKPSAIWHFGWGKVSLGDTYADHLANEVNWKPPYPALTADLHVHLRSRDPAAAAAWYESFLGATSAASAALDASPRTQPRIEGRAEAVVRVGAIALVIHWTEQEIQSTRAAGPIDHLAFVVPDVKALTTRAGEAGHPIVDRQYELRDVAPSVMIEGPDHIVLELLEPPKGPRFWHEHP